MLAVRYTYGTPCDLTSNQPRETVVYYGKEERRERRHDPDDL